MKIKNIYRFLMASAVLTCIAGCWGPGTSFETKNTGDTKEGYVFVTGGKVWYKIAGADRKGVPLLVVHGGPGAAHDYLDPITVLSNERPVVFYDQLGCGNSDNPADRSLWTRERYVKELGQVRSALRLKRVHILGHGWGTILAVDYMLQEKRPKGVASLILSAPVLSSYHFKKDQKDYLNAEFSRAVRNIIDKADATGDYGSTEYKDIVKIYYQRHFCRLTSWPGCLTLTMEKLNHELYGYMWGPNQFTLTGTLHDYECVERLPRLDIPTLFTCGRYGECTPETAALYRNAVPGAEIKILEDASHQHHLERPDEYIEDVGSFLRRVENTRPRKR